MSIPKIIHYCWISGDPYPEVVRNCINSWKRMLPDYEIKLWDASSFDFESCLWTKQALASGKYAFLADYIRFYALFNYGGIYLDSDVEVLKKFDDLLDLPYFVGQESNVKEPFPEIAAFGAEKGNKLVKDCLDFYNKTSFIKSDGSSELTSCPQFIFKNVIKDRYEVLGIETKEEFVRDEKSLCLFPHEYFCAHTQTENKRGTRSFKYCVSENTYCIHQFTNSWIKYKVGKLHRIYYYIKYGNKEKRDRVFKWFNNDGVITINTFYPDPFRTGGKIIDSKILDILKSVPQIRVHEITKENFFAPRWRFWNFFAILQMKRLTECDYILLDNKDLGMNMRAFFHAVRFFRPSVKFISINHHPDYLFCKHPGYVKFQERRILKKCDYVISVSPYVDDEMRTFMKGDRIRYVPLPFERKHSVISSYDKGKLLFTGSVIDRKGLDYLIEALSLIKEKIDFSLDIVGSLSDHSYYEKLKRMISEKGLDGKVEFSGRLDSAALQEKYKSSYCFVFPSLTEGFGMVIMEAMSFGLPVIAFDNTAIPYTVHNGENGILCRNKDINELAEAIYKMLTDREFHENCSEGALKTAASATTNEDFTEAVIKFADELISEKKK